MPHSLNTNCKVCNGVSQNDMSRQHTSLSMETPSLDDAISNALAPARRSTSFSLLSSDDAFGIPQHGSQTFNTPSLSSSCTFSSPSSVKSHVPVIPDPSPMTSSSSMSVYNTYPPQQELWTDQGNSCRMTTERPFSDDLSSPESFDVFPDVDELQFKLDGDSTTSWNSHTSNLYGTLCTSSLCGAPSTSSFYGKYSNESYFQTEGVALVPEPSISLPANPTNPPVPTLRIEDFDGDHTFEPAGWSYQQDQVLSTTEGNSQPMKKRSGRNRPLSEVSRVHAAMMRRRVACKRCKIARCKCGVHDPCKACVTKFGAHILREPCREPLVPRCVRLLLPDGLTWCPGPRSLVDFFGPNHSKSDYELIIPVTFGYGPAMSTSVRIVAPMEEAYCEHDHWIYKWPPSTHQSMIPTPVKHTVLPAMLSNTENLAGTLNRHIEILVEKENIYQFPSFSSGKFQVLPLLYNVYEHFCQYDIRAATILKSALKLLTLVHVGRDVAIDLSDVNVQQILLYAPTYATNPNVLPCYLRAQLGSAMPSLIQRYLNEVLQGLFTLLLNRSCDYFLAVHAITSILTMALESLQFHGAKIGLHANIDKHNLRSSSTSSSDHLARTSVEEGIAVIQRLYQICFGECHRRLLLHGLPLDLTVEQQQHSQQDLSTSTQQQQLLQASPGRGRRRRSSGSSASLRRPDPHSQATLNFTRRLNRAIAQAKPYLEQCAAIDLNTTIHSTDLTAYFDRWLARLYLLAPDAD